MKRIFVLILLVVLAVGSVLAPNKALSLDGDRDYVEVVSNKSLNISEHITMQAWVKYKDLVQGFGWTNYFKETKLSAFSPWEEDRS